MFPLAAVALPPQPVENKKSVLGFAPYERKT
jgi:hypothetical protein